MSVGMLLLAVRLLLLEQRVAFVSSSAAQLTSVCEALSQVLLYPLVWPHQYSVMVPSLEYLEAPYPFLFGALRPERPFDEDDDGNLPGLLANCCGWFPEDQGVALFDLDAGEAHGFCEADRLLPALPYEAEARLRRGLAELRSEADAAYDAAPAPGLFGCGCGSDDGFDAAVQGVFERFTSELLRDAAAALTEAAGGAADSEVEGPMRGDSRSSWGGADGAFYELFGRTQAFVDHVRTVQLCGAGQAPPAEEGGSAAAAAGAAQAPGYALPQLDGAHLDFRGR
ncbi:unnamed protein product [Prorocentrum cordatum]|uniref:cDENN domain-containing protein n=1 Tax=Prorocentrum cordatum TaxID=2364126 RepID=A0ABN9Y4X7_9DINO|nr:unnamed protein product [Polarella glacialis]